MMDTALGRLRLIGMIEGISFLLLLGIAMPLKYVWGMPIAVKIVGWAHGLLFTAFGVALLQVWTQRGWPLSRVMLVFFAALFPGGPFLIDKRLKEEMLQTPPAQTAGD